MSIPRPTATDAAEDLALVHASKNGDVAAFEQLVKRHDRRLLRIAQNVTHDLNDAQEVVQEAFLKAFQRLDQFREVAQFSTWLVRITLNECFMKLRKQRAAKEFLAEDVEVEMESVPSDVTRWVPNPEEIYSSTELQTMLRKGLGELTPGLRMVFVLRDIEELSINETAEALSLSPNAVKARLSRARLQLREKLSKYFAQGRAKSQPAHSGSRSRADQTSNHAMAVAV